MEQVLQGALDLLILKTLPLTPMHGRGLTHRIEQFSRNALRVGQGSIYPALVRLGRRALGQELASWNRFVSDVGLVIAAES